jgi:hypothetical protein
MNSRLTRAATLLLFAGLFGVFVAYRSGAFSRKEKALLPIQADTLHPLVLFPRDTTRRSEILSSSKSLIISEHGFSPADSALMKNTLDSLKKTIKKE